ncbi:efflux RND transporter periplasmic adaptor subunit [Chromohalobacter sp. TMW 2.2308]|uniref:Efflux RND transporter periplasmic adaptor subunit n=1 Tax=Chromohalobacter moromii TaxID=2860329 RepID=A0A9X3B497_9GAMM|nr:MULTISPECIES: efflux RND transporter periplasmic adaptor subunit [Chromohalobacter]MCK2041920.1 efflux RND transporter periplasmic adaptor subunit [Chromohalobacter moromii]MCK2044849.1 efflux RND transporter periplasmic adaptor subunit [Chromohalobacter moromii]MCT8503998.1 efflux RND transporter periplasmic adaptor subunit [Chromohalobacter moromii]MCT8514068.1 efflux RND transporter periplasmic adaptor subunit [Chromohalobacter sp. TMW 2.2271]
MPVFSLPTVSALGRYTLGLAALSLLALTGAQAQEDTDRTQVIAVKASTATWSDPLEALGTLRADESVTLSATVTETVAELNFYDAQRVAEGELLIRLDDSAEQAELRAARALRQERENAVRRARQLQDRNVGTRADFEDAQAQLAQVDAQIDEIQARLADHRLRAPFDGTVGQRNLSVGALVTPDTELVTLDKLDDMKLDFTVPATVLDMLTPGLSLSATTPSYPTRTFRGEVTSIGTRIDPVSRSVSVRARLPNPERILRPGMLMVVTLERNPRQTLVVPESVLVPSGDRQYVMRILRDADNRIQRHQVEIGKRRVGTVEILDGLSPGDWIVSHGMNKVRDGDHVDILALDDGSLTISEILETARDGAVHDEQERDGEDG